MLCIDLDRFKAVNDMFGHSAGDALLRRSPSACRRPAEGAFLARLGGDEFCVISPTGPQPAIAEALAARLRDGARRRLRDRRPAGAASASPSASPSIRSDGDDATTLLANADAALYRAKAEARGTIRFFEPEMDKQLREQARAAAGSAPALERRRARALHYQPQAEIDGEIIGFEALAALASSAARHGAAQRPSSRWPRKAA